MSTRLDLSSLSLMDALDLAKLIEMEACHRYQMFAAQLGRTGGYDAGAFFASMAENEAKHGQELEARRKELFGDAPSRLSLDDLYDVDVTGVARVFLDEIANGEYELSVVDLQVPPLLSLTDVIPDRCIESTAGNLVASFNCQPALHQDDLITLDSAMAASDYPDELKLDLKGIVKGGVANADFNFNY